MFGFDNNYHKDSRIVSSQTLSGTGALKIISDFLAKFKGAPIYLSNPSLKNQTTKVVCFINQIENFITHLL